MDSPSTTGGSVESPATLSPLKRTPSGNFTDDEGSVAQASKRLVRGREWGECLLR